MLILYISTKIKKIVKLKWLLLGLSILNVLIWSALTQNDKSDTVYFFDIGQGDAAMIQLQNNTQILIDTGPGIEVVYELAKVMPKNDRTIEMVFISHLHDDHFGGLEYVRKHYSVGTIFVNTCNDGDGFKIYGLNGESIYNFVSGDMVYGDALSVSSLWPPSEYCEIGVTDENDLSQILLIVSNNVRILFTGDAEFGSNTEALYDFEYPDVDILKVPHHGSMNAVTKELLERTSPVKAIVSVGENYYGHPDQGTLDLLFEHSVEVLRTDQIGTVAVDLELLKYDTAK